MENLNIEPTKSSPKINFDTSINLFQIIGQSYPENAASFYEPIFNWIEKYLLEVTEPFTLVLKLDYLNTSSSKAIMTLLDMLEDAHQNGKNISIQWHYNSDDDLSLECGENFKEDLELPFNLIEDKN